MSVPLLTVIVPAYNSEDYLDRALTTLVGYGDELEVIIVNDGSKDRTAEIADEWASRYPSVKVIHQENKGHGGAVNAGLAAATGTHVRVVDSDDWLDRRATNAVLDVLREEREAGRDLDLLVTNYVYDKQGKAHKAVIRYRNVLPRGRTFGWADLRRCRYDQYLMMHALTMRTEVVRASGLVMPEHTFYVDYLYSFVPLPYISTIRYLDVDLYHYFIGRDDQSVNEKVMITRLDQLARVNEAMTRALPPRADVEDKLWRYMVHYLPSWHSCRARPSTWPSRSRSGRPWIRSTPRPRTACARTCSPASYATRRRRLFAAATRSRRRSSASTKGRRQCSASTSSVQWTVRRLPMSGYSTSSSRLCHAKPSFSETRREASFPSKYFRTIIWTPSSRARSMMACPASVAYPLPQ